MRRTLINKLACPFDKQDLDLKVYLEDTEKNIIEGILTCKHCKRYYPIVYGIPILAPDEYREPALETPVLKKWENKLEGQFADGFYLLNGKANN